MRTTYPDPDGWPGPRVPQHAAATFGHSSPYRLQASRALRLFVTTGTWAAGLCLIIGLLVLIASAAPGRLARANTASAHQHDSRQLPPGVPANLAAADGTGSVVAAFSGHGDATTRQFLLSSAGRWQIQWSYRCPASLPVGLLVVEDAGPGAAGASINESGAAGHGETWLNPDGRSHRLVVISTCSWTMKVTQT
jgi:hypothetical protein